MNKWGLYILSAIMGITLFSNCSSTPDEVLPQEKMAQLLADIHIGESIVDAERTKYYNDSLKKNGKTIHSYKTWSEPSPIRHIVCMVWA